MVKSIEFKKGDLPDMLIFLVFIFIFAIGLFVMSFIIPEIATGLSDSGLNESSGGSEAIDGLTEFGVNGMQRGFFILFIGLIMSTMITAFLTKSHPIFLFIYILFLGVTLFLGGYLGNAFEQFISSPAFMDTIGTQGLISTVMQNIVMITLVVGVLSMIIVFSKFSGFSSSNQGGGF